MNKGESLLEQRFFVILSFTFVQSTNMHFSALIANMLSYSELSQYNELERVAVGMVITDHPPHRSGRALLTHPAPTSGIWRKSVVPDKDVQS